MAGKSPEATAYEHIRHELQTHLDKGGAPEEVRAFLLEQWARLMTGIFMAKGNADPDWHAGWETVNALLWTLAPKQSRADTLKMLRILPTLLARLHEGCAALNYDLAARDRLFSDLAMLHASIARESLHLAENEPLPVPPAPMPGEGGARDREISQLQPAPVEPAQPAAAGESMPELRLGDWVRFLLPVGQKRLKLTWLSPQQGMYLFTDPQGSDALSLTRSRLRAKFQSREAALEGDRGVRAGAA